MQYAEDFKLPDGQQIITTRDHPFCPALEGSFQTVLEKGLLQEYHNVDVGVVVRNLFKEMDEEEEWTSDWNVEIVMVRVRRAVFSVVDTDVLSYQWQNGVICDPGLLHGFMVNRIYGVRAHRTQAMLGAYWRGDRRKSGGLITAEGIRAQNEAIGRRTCELVDVCQSTWRTQWHAFMKKLKDPNQEA